MNRPKLFLLASLAAVFTAVVWSVPASADEIVYSNFGPGNTYAPGSFGVGSTSWAGAFTPSANFDLTEIAVGIMHRFGTNGVILSLELANSAGLPDDIPLEKPFTLTDLPDNAPCTATVCAIQPSQIVKTPPLRLLKGTEYWLVASRISPSSTDMRWHYNLIGAVGVAQRSSAGAWSSIVFTSPGFAIFGVPEPATLGLLALGLLGAGLARRKRPN